jgi:hypothetical protein
LTAAKLNPAGFVQQFNNHMQKILLLFLLLISFFISSAQTDSIKSKQWYFSRSTDAAIVSFSTVTRNGIELAAVPRFTFFINGGTNFNYNISKHIGFYTGWNITNNGIVYNENDSIRYKRRTILIGTPFAIKAGNLTKGNFFYCGVQGNYALHYKEKKFLNLSRIEKKGEWFGKQTPNFVPSLFAGFYTAKGVGMRACYFPQNFFNNSYEKNGVKPFEGMEARNIFFVTVSYNFSIIQRILQKYMK